MTDDLISRKTAIDLLKKWSDGYSYIEVETNSAIKAFEEMPSAQSERKNGRWIRNDNGTYSCSVCQSWIPEQQHCYARYCLYCGAEMRENDNEK